MESDTLSVVKTKELLITFRSYSSRRGIDNLEESFVAEGANEKLTPTEAGTWKVDHPFVKIDQE